MVLVAKKDDVYGDHISNRFNDELLALKTRFLKMGGLVETQIDSAVVALMEGDTPLAEDIRGKDKLVDKDGDGH